MTRVPGRFAQLGVVDERVVVHARDVLTLPGVVMRVSPPIRVDERMVLGLAPLLGHRAHEDELVRVEPGDVDSLEVGECVARRRPVLPIVDLELPAASVSYDFLRVRTGVTFGISCNACLVMVTLDVERDDWW